MFALVCLKFFLPLEHLNLSHNNLLKKVDEAEMTVRVRVAIVKMVTSLAVSVKTVIVHAVIAKKEQTVALIVLVVSSLTLHQNFLSVPKQNVFVRFESM
jgi:hypothetical protein